MPGEHYGDYVMLDIDLATGRITGWEESCTPGTLQEAAESESVTTYWPPRPRKP